MIARIPVLLILAQLYQVASEPADQNIGSWLTGKKFQQEIERPFSGNWSNVEFRYLLKEIATNRRTAIVLDRRLDPSAEHPINVANASLRTGLIGIAKHADGDATFPGNIAYLGPRSATRILRTLIELRSLELQAKELGISRQRRTELLRPQLFQTLDLDSPQEILNQITKPARLRIANVELVKHDLWGAMILPETNVIEALSIVLIQFDLTFRWIDEGQTIELVPIPDPVILERKYPAKKKPIDSFELIRQQFPRLDVEATKTEIVIKGLLEDHEAVASLLRGGNTGPVRIEAPKPLNQRLFKLEAKRAPVIKLMKLLEESAVSFDYDPEAFNTAGIDLEKTVDIDVKQVSANELFRLIFDPVGVEFQIENLTVKLKPKKP